MKYRLLLAITPLVIGLDQVTKAITLQRFAPGETLSLISGFFNLTFIKNTGAAFGILASADPVIRTPLFLLVPLLSVLAMAYVFKRLRADDAKMATALSLVMGGAIGNLIDRVQLGYVVDFLDFHWQYQGHFPAFNVADSAIFIGVAILMLDLAHAPSKSEETVEAHASATH